MGVYLLILHVCLALGIITLVLLQKGKGASEGATFGGGGSSSVFGASGSSNFLSKTTAILATVFFINSLALAYLAANRDAPTSVFDSVEQQLQQDKAAPDLEAPLFNSSDENVPQAADLPAAAGSDLPPPATK